MKRGRALNFSAASPAVPKPAQLQLNLPGPFTDGRKPWVFERSEELIRSLKEEAAALYAELANDNSVPHNCCAGSS